MALRVRPASTYQPRDDVLRVLARKAQGGIGRELRGALAHLGDSMDVKKAAFLLRNGRLGEIPDTIGFGHFAEVLKAPLGKIGDLYITAGHEGAKRINRVFTRAGRNVRFNKPFLFYKDARSRVASLFNYDRFAPSTQESIRLYQDRFIQQLTNDARDTIEATVLAGLRSGFDADTIAGDIRDVIGLTDRQASAVQNYRAMLYDLDSQALARQLSDYADDDALRVAIASGQSLSDAAVNQMVANYESNYLDYRALTIARTESIRAANAGIRDGYQQAVDRGALTQESVKRVWRVALDEKTCPVCLSIPDLNPDGVGLDEDFDSDDGPMGDPPDPHPNCRCTVDYVTNLDMLPEPEEVPEEEAPPSADTSGEEAVYDPTDVGLQGEGVAAAKAAKDMWVRESPLQEFRAVMDAAPDNQAQLALVADRIAADNGAEFVNPGVKSEKRTQEKIEAGRVPAAVTDIVRGGFKVDSPQQADEIVAALARNFQIADEGWAITPAGYFDRKVLIRFANGQIGEIQLWEPSLFNLKEFGGGHALYEQSRALPDNDPMVATLNQQMVNLYSPALGGLSPAWKAVFGKA